MYTTFVVACLALAVSAAATLLLDARWKRDGSLDEAVEYAYQLRSRLMRVDDICEAIMSRYCLDDSGLRSVMRRAGLISGD